MEKKMLKFPENFLWGASTSAFQVEGGIHEGGKGVASTDVRRLNSDIADSSVASDHYHHWKEDIQLMKELGMKIYRFSFCWSRIMSDGYHVNEEGLAFYDQIVDECLKYGIQPFPTLYHFEMPQALIDEFGGWKSRKCLDAYVNYACVCFEHFKGRITMWATVNEQMCACAADDMNGNLEQGDEMFKLSYQMSYHMSLAEKLAIKEFRKIIPNGKIGPVCAIQVVYPKTSHPNDILASKDAKDLMQNMYLDMSVYGRYPKRVSSYLKQKGYYPKVENTDKEILESFKPDFIGINYYASLCVRQKLASDDATHLPTFFQSDLYIIDKNDYIQTTEWMSNGIDSLGIYLGIRDIFERYQLPVIVTENGMAYSDKLENGQIEDDYRIYYLYHHLKECHHLIDEGYPLIGYCPWSFVDLVSSHQGFRKRYGLIYVNRSDEDVMDCKRIPKKSYYWYKQVIQQNGIEEE